jgi:hypothetical protein
MSAKKNSNESNSVYFQMHRITWNHDGHSYSLFLAGTERQIVDMAAERLSMTIAAEGGHTVDHDVLVSSNVDIDVMPF